MPIDPLKEPCPRHANEKRKSSGLRRLEVLDGPKYGLFRAANNTDPFVQEALKLYEPDLYKSLKGWTKRPGGVPELLNSLQKFNNPDIHPSKLDPSFLECVNSAVYAAGKAFKLPDPVHKTPKSVVIQQLDQPTSAGISFTGKKNENLDEIFDRGSYLNHLAKRFGWKTHCPISLATTRGALTDLSVKSPKTRLAWNIPAEVLFVEGTLGHSLIESYGQSHTAYFGGKNLMLRLRARLTSPFVGTYVGMDWSSFDSSVPSFIIRHAFRILWDNMDLAHKRNGRPYSPKRLQKMAKLREFIEYHFINTIIRMPDGTAWRKNHGIPSGSWFTSIIGSICNYIVITALSLFVELDCNYLVVMGDDSDFLVPPAYSHEEIASRISKMKSVAATQLGMELNESKTRIQPTALDRKFMGYQFRGGALYRPTQEWFLMMLYPETNVTTLDISWSRMLGFSVVGILSDLKAFRFITFLQTCYDIRAADPHELREQRFFNRVFELDIDYKTVDPYHLMSAMFRKKTSTYAITCHTPPLV